MEREPKHRFLGGDVKGHDVNAVREPQQHLKNAQKGMIYVASQPGLPDWRKKRHDAVEGGKAGLTNMGGLKENHRGVSAGLFERLK